MARRGGGSERVAGRSPRSNGSARVAAGVNRLSALDLVEPRAPDSGRAWLNAHARRVFVIDLMAVSLAVAAATLASFGAESAAVTVQGHRVAYGLIGALAVPPWLALVGLQGGYAGNDLGNGSEEFRRLVRAGMHFFVLVAIGVFLFKLRLSRTFVLSVTTLAVGFLASGRFIARRYLRRIQRRGGAHRRVIVIGTTAAVRQVVIHLDRSWWAGYHVIGACVPGLARGDALNGDHRAIPVLGPVEDLSALLQSADADVIAVAGDEALGPYSLRNLAWRLEGSGVDLVVAPVVADVAGPRISIRPVSGLPLLHVEEPRLSGPTRVSKEGVDRILAAVGLVVLAPLLLLLAFLVKTSGRGPVLFRQQRVGRRGEIFTMYKFRTMVHGAEQARDDLLHRNDHDGLLFKIREDPRVTRLGRRLRRRSLDELPQLVNVLRGEMSLVGPRPPLPSEVEAYGDDIRRRLLVKPGLTGLWQVSGRADLPWDEAVRLDLYYVDNWSPSLDFVIMWKTVYAWLSGRGAY